MLELDDTIAAISTPLGEGAIGIVRLSGPRAFDIAERIFISPKNKSISQATSHSMLYGFIVNPDTQETIDEVLLTVLKAPNTYTREDMVEINCHGGVLAVRKVLELVLGLGARLAEPGEFTLRAFVNGRIDLSQAEATADLIKAKTERSSKIALDQLKGSLSNKIKTLRESLTEVVVHIEAYIDFPEEELDLETEDKLINRLKTIKEELQKLSLTYEEARFYRDGVAVAIVGRPNVGKSSLLNRLMQQDRAIVTEIPGTTRDVIEEYLNLEGLPVRIMDTAGIRKTHDLAEAEGVRRSLQAIEGADLILALLDLSQPLTEEDRFMLDKVRHKNTLLVLNKADLKAQLPLSDLPDEIQKVRISAKTGDGLDELKKAILRQIIKKEISSEGVVITNMRHKLAIDRAVLAITRTIDAIKDKAPYEIIALEARDALNSLGEIIGEVTTDDILNRIFSSFCIGK
ncbi:MAG: tRNA uridine-5-carboxymethylaminomethyl(34) synthesis GTPase MnmE [Nitrospirae bacterium]|nr:tRNA uridine-5-carboxymethylaminomethyl(34) synthesis GTPase MnmE [Nitrospirota bacterium]